MKRCVVCNWQIGKHGTYTDCYREVDGWVCIFCLARFAEIHDAAIARAQKGVR